MLLPYHALIQAIAVRLVASQTRPAGADVRAVAQLQEISDAVVNVALRVVARHVAGWNRVRGANGPPGWTAERARVGFRGRCLQSAGKCASYTYSCSGRMTVLLR